MPNRLPLLLLPGLLCDAALWRNQIKSLEIAGRMPRGGFGHA